MYDQRYYDDRKKELSDDFNIIASRGLQKICQLTDEIRFDLQASQKKYQDLVAQEAESKKQTEAAVPAPDVATATEPPLEAPKPPQTGNTAG
jgi:hypothetical protein